MSRITRLTIENVLRLYAVELVFDPDENTFIIGGDNAQGKSAVLDSLEMLFSGKSSIPDDPIRHGATKGRIVGETERLIITRTFPSPGTSYLKVEAKDGSDLGSPQAVLDELFSNLTFNPLAFLQMDRKEQVAEWQKVLGLDFTELDAEYAETYKGRKAVNAEWTRLKGDLKGLPQHADAANEEVNVVRVMEELEAAQVRNAQIEREHLKVEGLRDDSATATAELDEAVTELAEAERRIEALKEKRDGIAVTLTKAADAVTKLERIDTEPLTTQIREADATNTAVRGKKAYAEAVVGVRRKKAQSDALTSDLEAIDEEKAEDIAKAKCPVPGMTFTPDTVLLNDVPLDQASSAEQLRVSTAIGFALNPELKLVLVRNASLLDDESMAIMAQMAKDAGGQLLLERVGKDEGAFVIIEDGRVLETVTEKAAEEGGQ